MSIVERELKKLGLRKAYDFLDSNPEENLPKIVDWFDKYVPDGVLEPQIRVFRRIAMEKNSNWHNLLVSLWDDLDEGIRKTLFENLLVNANALAAPKAKANKEKNQCNIPWAISMDIEDSGDEKSLTFDEWDDIIEQAKELGTFMFVFEGKEPVDSLEELIALCNKHYDCAFMLFTDGSWVTEAFADEMLRVKNLILAVRTFDGVVDEQRKRVFELLRRKKVAFLTFAVVDRDNQERFAKEAFFDQLMENGVKLGFFFARMPEHADTIYEKLVEYRRNKPIMTIHFCRDTEIMGGCIAGGKYFCSIDSQGNLTPCFFRQASDTNLQEKRLLEGLQSPLFQEYYNTDIACRAEKK